MSDKPVSILQRRRIEALFVKELLQHLTPEVGAEKSQAIIRATTTAMARQFGERLAADSGVPRPTLEQFRVALPMWQEDDALQIEYLEDTPERLSFNVTRCRYAELYRELGMPELGEVMSCTRDGEMCRGFNDRIQLTRTQTIMQGATHCDFRFIMEEEKWPQMNTDEHG